MHACEGALLYAVYRAVVIREKVKMWLFFVASVNHTLGDPRLCGASSESSRASAVAKTH